MLGKKYIHKNNKLNRNKASKIINFQVPQEKFQIQQEHNYYYFFFSKKFNHLWVRVWFKTSTEYL